MAYPIFLEIPNPAQNLETCSVLARMGHKIKHTSSERWLKLRASIAKPIVYNVFANSSPKLEIISIVMLHFGLLLLICSLCQLKTVLHICVVK